MILLTLAPCGCVRHATADRAFADSRAALGLEIVEADKKVRDWECGKRTCRFKRHLWEEPKTAQAEAA